MKKVFLCMSAMIIIVSCAIAQAKDEKMQDFVNAIKKNDADKVKKSYEALRKKKETDVDLRSRIKEYYAQKSQDEKSNLAYVNSPVMQALIADGERNGPVWQHSLEALRDLGFANAAKALKDSGY